MRIRFTKMHGIGNDFVMIDAISQKVNISGEDARKLADRHFGIGCDQVLVVEPPRNPDMDFRYRIFNHDGSEVENCGNGARCFAIFVQQRGLTSKNAIKVETLGGELNLTVMDDKRVRVDMGVPRLLPSEIPFKAEQQSITYPLTLADEELLISAVSMGNPHAVCVVNDLSHYPVEKLGPLVENHPDFPNRVNAGFMEVVSPSEIHLRVYERGAGETIACGTGACAAVVAGRLRGLLEQRVLVNLRGGQLELEWEGEGKPVIMSGPVQAVFHGQTRI